MNNSSNLKMTNTEFYKVQIRPGIKGVVHITCPDTGCETTFIKPILIDNLSVKFINYGHNFHKGLSSFIFIDVENISLEITKSTFEYNITAMGVLYAEKLR